MSTSVPLPRFTIVPTFLPLRRNPSTPCAEQRDLSNSLFSEILWSYIGQMGNRFQSVAAAQRYHTSKEEEDRVDKNLVNKILKDGKIDKAEMKVIASYVADSHNLTKEEKLCLKEIFTKISSGEVKLEV